MKRDKISKKHSVIQGQFPPPGKIYKSQFLAKIFPPQAVENVNSPPPRVKFFSENANSSPNSRASSILFLLQVIQILVHQIPIPTIFWTLIEEESS